MAQKWTIRELAPDEYPDTQLRYEVRDETSEVVSLHYWEEDAQQMAAVPLMLETLKATLVQLQSMGGLISETTIQRIQATIEEAQYDWEE